MLLNNCYFRFTLFDGNFFDVKYIDDDLFLDIRLTTLKVENVIKFWLRGFISFPNNILFQLSVHYGISFNDLEELKKYAHSIRFDDTDLTMCYFKIDIVYKEKKSNV